MTEKIARRGIRAPAEYEADILDRVHVRDIMSPKVISLNASEDLKHVLIHLCSNEAQTSHQGFPVLNEQNVLVGVVTRRDLIGSMNRKQEKVCDIVKGLPRIVYDDCTARQAVDHMVKHDIGRLPVVRRDQPAELVGIVTRSDILSIFRSRETMI